MPKLDPFSAQIVKLVRQLPDAALLELVRNQLGSVSTETTTESTGGALSVKKDSSRISGKKHGTVKRRNRQTKADKKAMLLQVERVVKGAGGLSASQVATKTRIAQTRVSAALRELKQAKRIYQGGERRFARYAGDLKTANKASNAARKSIVRRK